MNRLKEYFKSAQLAKMFLTTAKETKDPARAQSSLIQAMELLITANNNLASIAFNRKPKGVRRPKKKVGITKAVGWNDESF